MPVRSNVNKLALLSILLLAGTFLGACAKDIPPLNCQDPDIKCYIDHTVDTLKVIRENINYWSNVNLFAQALIVIFGIVATVMIALQGDDNKHWTRPIGLVATALVTGLTSALVSFHVPDNVDKLVDTYEHMMTAANELDYQAEKLLEGRTPTETAERFKTDKQFREDVNDMTMKFVGQFNKFKVDMLRLSGTAAKLNSLQEPPAKSSPSAGTKSSEK